MLMGHGEGQRQFISKLVGENGLSKHGGIVMGEDFD